MIMTLKESNREILLLLAEGKTYKEIAGLINKKVRTIKQRIRSMKDSEGCSSVAQLVAKMKEKQYAQRGN